MVQPHIVILEDSFGDFSEVRKGFYNIALAFGYSDEVARKISTDYTQCFRYEADYIDYYKKAEKRPEFSGTEEPTHKIILGFFDQRVPYKKDTGREGCGTTCLWNLINQTGSDSIAVNISSNKLLNYAPDIKNVFTSVSLRNPLVQEDSETLNGLHTMNTTVELDDLKKRSLNGRLIHEYVVPGRIKDALRYCSELTPEQIRNIHNLPIQDLKNIEVNMDRFKPLLPERYFTVEPPPTYDHILNESERKVLIKRHTDKEVENRISSIYHSINNYKSLLVCLEPAFKEIARHIELSKPPETAEPGSANPVNASPNIKRGDN